MQSNYEYNLFIIQRTKIRATEKLQTGRVRIEVETGYILSQTGGPLKVAIKVNGKLLAEGYRAGQRAAALYRHDCLDIGIALGSTVSLDDQDKAPFKFDGAIERVHVRYVAPTYGTSVMKRRTLGSPEAIVAAALILVVVGVVTHGFHRSDIERGWQNLLGRPVSRRPQFSASQVRINFHAESAIAFGATAHRLTRQETATRKIKPLMKGQK